MLKSVTDSISATLALQMMSLEICTFRPLTIPTAPMATSAVTTAYALEPRPRPRTPVKAPRRTGISAGGRTDAVAHAMVTRPDRDWV